jgi:hypothetical protein
VKKLKPDIILRILDAFKFKIFLSFMLVYRSLRLIYRKLESLLPVFLHLYAVINFTSCFCMDVSLVRWLCGKVIDGGCWRTNSQSYLYPYFVQLLYVEYVIVILFVFDLSFTQKNLYFRDHFLKLMSTPEASFIKSYFFKR